MPATLDTPAAPAPNVGAAVPSSKGEIHVGADGVIGTASPEPVKIKPPRDRLNEALEKKANKNEQAIAPAPEAPKPPEARPGEESPKPADATDKTPAATEDKTPKGKVNPWKLADEHKARAAKAEQEIVELRKLIPNEAERKSEMEELKTTRSRIKELENAIRFVDYSKSAEFKDKFQQPYEKAFGKAMADLGEITITDPVTDAKRAVTAMDFLKLVNLPLGEARTLANSEYGDFANDVMAHRNEVKKLWQVQSEALEKARTEGEERHQKTEAELKSSHEAMNKMVSVAWQKANELATKDEKYGPLFMPVEGDQDGNQRLAKGFELVDRAFKESPMNPNLTNEERQAIVKRHAAVRNRAAGFGRLFAQKLKLDSELTSLKKELAKYQGSVPAAVGSPPPPPNGTPANTRDSMYQKLERMAK